VCARYFSLCRNPLFLCISRNLRGHRTAHVVPLSFTLSEPVIVCISRNLQSVHCTFDAPTLFTRQNCVGGAKKSEECHLCLNDTGKNAPNKQIFAKKRVI